MSTALFQVKLKKVLVALGFAFSSLTLIAPTPSKAEKGCPRGFLPIGGGYCRSVECTPNTMRDYPDMELSEQAIKLGWKCPGNVGQLPWVRWGTQTIPMR